MSTDLTHKLFFMCFNKFQLSSVMSLRSPVAYVSILQITFNYNEIRYIGSLDCHESQHCVQLCIQNRLLHYLALYYSDDGAVKEKTRIPKKTEEIFKLVP